MNLSCKEVSELVSQSLERKLRLRERIAVRLHLMMCRMCTNYRKQILFLHDAIRQLRVTGHPAEPRMSKDARMRIEKALQDSSDDA